MAKQEDVEEYFKKSSWIKSAVYSLRASDLIADGWTDPNIERILKTNENNLMLLMQFRWEPEKLGKMAFWACRKTVDMNENTMRHTLERHGIDPNSIW